MISVVTITYGRTHLLDEMIQSFLAQDYTDSHLHVLNDHPQQRLVFDHPRVTIVNASPFANLGAKRNAAVALATGQWLALWDDDDLYLPSHLSTILAATQLYRYQRCSKQWVQWNDGGHRLYRIEPATLLHTMLIDRQLFLDLGGYPETNRNHDIPVVRAILQAGYLVGPPAWDLSPPTCIYRTAHGAARLTDHPEHAARDAIAADAHARAVPTGTIALCPAWRQDYAALAARSFEALP